MTTFGDVLSNITLTAGQSIRLNGGGSSVQYDMYLRKNNSTFCGFTHEGASGDPFSMQVSGIAEANGSSDYFDVFFYQASSSVALQYGLANSIFGGYKLIT